MKTFDIHNKEDRRRLTGLWLNTDTTIDEERILADYYRNNRPDDDEKEEATLILSLQSMEIGPLPGDNGLENEYDRIMSRQTVKGKSRRIMLRIAGIAAAAAVILAVVLKTTGTDETGHKPYITPGTNAQTATAERREPLINIEKNCFMTATEV